MLCVCCTGFQNYFVDLRASDPEEIYKIHELKIKKEQAANQESHLDQLIQLCKQELTLLMENQENWQYPRVYRERERERERERVCVCGGGGGEKRCGLC